MTTGTFLSLEAVHAAYGRKEILRGVNLSVNSGEIAALIGPNGSGKSTLIKVIAGILKPAAGAIRMNGEDITQTSAAQRIDREIGYFMQGGEVFRGMSVHENMVLGGYRLKPSELSARLREVNALFPKLQTVRGLRAGALSGGERQALALAMVLINRPRLLLLDEPSAGLSPALVKHTLNRVKEINEKYGTTVILVEQNIKEALRVSQRAFILKDGRIVSEENPARLLEDETAAVHRLF